MQIIFCATYKGFNSALNVGDIVDVENNGKATTVPEMPFDWVNQRRIDNEVKQRGLRAAKNRWSEQNDCSLWGR